MSEQTRDEVGDWLALGKERTALLAFDVTQLPGHVERVLGSSDYVFNQLQRDESLRHWLTDSDVLTAAVSAEQFESIVRDTCAACDDEASLMRQLRHIRHHHMVRIAWRDIGELADFDSLAAETSWLADAIIDTALGKLHEFAVVRRGQPMDADGAPQHLFVLALGKLGAGELNFSSDIDLIFGFPASGETRGGARPESNEEFFLRLARRLIHVLGTLDTNGFVYRVDMRLRPFGNSGPLVSSIPAIENYYETHGRDWERYAFIRARVVAGDRQSGEALLHLLQPFIYRRYLDFSALESIREMKAMINAEVRREGMQDNVKIGPGGIREVEFLAQAFQLVRGGRTRVLRRREVRPVLTLLGELSLLPAHAARALLEAYRFLRTLEHRLQQVDDKQTHSIPTDQPSRARLAFALGFESWASLSEVVEGHRAHVREHFDQIFGTESGEAADTREADPLSPLLGTQLEDEDAVAMLRAAGYGDRATDAWEPVAKLLAELRMRHLSDRMHQRFSRLLPDLVRAAAGTQNPVVALERLCEVLAIIAQRGAYVSLLVERPLALSQLVRLCAGSALIADHIRQYPLVIDELLDSRTLYMPLHKPELSANLDTQLEALEAGDLEQEMETLRREKQTNLLRVAAADLSRALPLMVVSDHLTETAEVSVERVMTIAWRDVTQKHGTPHYEIDGETHTAGFAVIAYGKLGGIELSYGSDLDLVFLHGSTGLRQETDGPRVVSNEVFFARLAQRIMHIMSARTISGILYEVDLRLRPSGASGLLVSSLKGFANYQRDEAWTWEHQALVRARVICGDPALTSAFKAIRAEILTRPRDAETLRNAVRDMRSRMRAELDVRDETLFDIKQSPGGIADIEFVVQYLVLRWASKLGEHLVFTDNIRLLEGIEASGILPAEQTRLLANAYRSYRARVHALALQKAPPVVPAEEFLELRTAVTAVWKMIMEP
jgi:glutamate-ammonia-ligase adenylyltransferase